MRYRALLDLGICYPKVSVCDLLVLSIGHGWEGSRFGSRMRSLFFFSNWSLLSNDPFVMADMCLARMKSCRAKSKY